MFSIWNFVKNKKLEISNGFLILVTAFPVLENVIMKQHAWAYTYDRMKASFVLIFIICETLRNLLENLESVRFEQYIIVFLTLLCAVLNLYSYMNDKTYTWEIDYRRDNKILADYINEQYPDALYAADSDIRGYMNLLWSRGIYERQTFDSAYALAQSLNKDKIIYIGTNGYKIMGVTAYDLINDSKINYSVIEHAVTANELIAGL